MGASRTTSTRIFHRPRRKRFLLIIVLVIAAYYGIWHRSERATIGRLEELGARVPMGKNSQFPTMTPLRRMLIRLGLPLQHDPQVAISVQFVKWQCQKVALHELPALSHVHFVRIDGMEFDERSIRYLTQLPRLKSLEFRQTQLTDTGLKIACQIPTLQILELSGSRITNDGLKPLQNLSALETLRLNDTAITDQAVPHILKATSLRQIWLHNTGLTEQGIDRLRKMPNIDRILQ